MLKRLFLVACFAVFFAGACTPPPAAPDAKAHALVAGGALLVDVRTGPEFWWSHVDGAVNVPVGDLLTYVKDVDKKRPIVVYSRTGTRSAKAAAALSAAGYTAYDMGGKFNW